MKMNADPSAARASPQRTQLGGGTLCASFRSVGSPTLGIELLAQVLQLGRLIVVAARTPRSQCRQPLYCLPILLERDEQLPVGGL